MSLLLLFGAAAPSGDYSLDGTGSQLTLTGGTATFALSVSATGSQLTLTGGVAFGNVSLAAAGSALALSGGTAYGNVSFAGTGTALALSGGTATFAVALGATGGALTLTGGDAAFNVGGDFSLNGTGAALALTGGAATFSLSLAGAGSVLTFTGGTATFDVTGTEPVITRTGGDDKVHPGWNRKRATLKRDREREFTEQIRDMYRTLLGDPRTAERAEQIVASVTDPTPSRGESEAAREAMLMLRAEAMRKRSDAMDEQALQAEIALRFLHQELREIQEAEDLDVLNMLLPMMLGLRAQPVDEARQQIARDLWDDEYDFDAIRTLLAQVL